MKPRHEPRDRSKMKNAYSLPNDLFSMHLHRAASESLFLLILRSLFYVLRIVSVLIF